MKTHHHQQTPSGGSDHRLVLLWLRFRVWLRWRFWRGKVCPGTGKRCKAMNCNICADNCYVTYAEWKEENVEVSDRPT